MNPTFQDFMADLNALVRQQPDTEIEAIIWLNSLQYNMHNGDGANPARRLEQRKLWRNRLMHDPVNNPAHYMAHPSHVECIDITEHMNFCLGNAVKYIWRADLKNDAIEDLEKAVWYINREIQRREKLAGK
jgi:hypothetical protein